MNVLIINASPRKNGITSKLLAQAEAAIGSTHRVEIIRIQDLTIRALKTILRAAGIKMMSVLNVPDSYNFERKRERYLAKARRSLRSISSL